MAARYHEKPKNFAELLQRKRVLLGYNGVQMAAVLGVKQSDYQRAESGEVKRPWAVLHAYLCTFRDEWTEVFAALTYDCRVMNVNVVDENRVA